MDCPSGRFDFAILPLRILLFLYIGIFGDLLERNKVAERNIFTACDRALRAPKLRPECDKFMTIASYRVLAWQLIHAAELAVQLTGTNSGGELGKRPLVRRHAGNEKQWFLSGGQRGCSGPDQRGGERS
jgi:hypothetical protein